MVEGTGSHGMMHPAPIATLLWVAWLTGAYGALPPQHKVSCDGRPCRPGEGNPSVTHSDNPYEFPLPPDVIKGVPHDPDPGSTQYAALVAQARKVAHHHFIIMTAADFDYRELVENWHRALLRSGHDNGLVYAVDSELHSYLQARRIPTVDGSSNSNAWNRTRLQRHIQQVDAEKHLAAAAVAASGLDVLLTETSHVLLHNVVPALSALTKSGEMDMAVARECNGKPPVGCNPLWNLVFLHGSGTAEQRQRAVAWQQAGVRRGLVDFYLRW